jgi:hypothetical protein
MPKNFLSGKNTGTEASKHCNFTLTVDILQDSKAIKKKNSVGTIL